MTRIVKDADVRRDELLDTALSLFLECGYERTSVEHITAAVGVAKGTFYHYFATKQELLEQLVGRFTDELFVEAEQAISQVDGSAIDRLRAFFVASSQIKLGRKNETLMLTRPLFMPENQLLLSRMMEGWIDQTRPIVLSIIQQGCAEGTFHVPDPEAMAEVWLSLWFDFGIRASRQYFSAQDDASEIDKVVAATKALQLAEERILGLEEGSLDMNVEAALRAVLSQD
ncbi:MAG: TetR/AcrR family transcriptional regulator [Coriobacteriia bacterium]|nr:TetR/AcrR family transcriptional regulator [Coriobacteriia bacterium]